MPIPVVTANADVVLNYSASAQNVALGASATESPTQWQWDMLSVPPGSTANVGTNGDFTNGIATIQNPSFDTDPGVEGSYVLQARAMNATGWSDPEADAEGGQQIAVVKTQKLAVAVPGDHQRDWGNPYLVPTLKALETAVTQPTSQGVRITAVNDQVSVNRTQGSATFAAIDANLTKTVSIPYTGKYRLRLDSGFFGTGFSGFINGRWRINIDSGAQFVGGDPTLANYGWDVAVNVASDSRFFSFEEEVELTAGDHQFSIEWARINTGGGGLLNVTTTVNHRLSLELISGSGVGGEVVASEDRTTSSDVITGASFADVTYSAAALLVQVVVTEGEEVVVEFVGQGRSNAGAFSRPRFRILHVEGAVGVGIDPIVNSIDTADYQTTTIVGRTGPLQTGTHTFKLQAIIDAGADYVLNKASLICRQARGGIVPIQQDGVTKLTKHVAQNYIGAEVVDNGGVADISLPAAVTALGSRVVMFHDDAASTQTIVSGTFADIPGSALPEQQFTVPFTGLYDLFVTLAALSSVTSDELSEVEYQLLFDEGNFNGFTEQTIGASVDPTGEWRIAVRNSGSGATGTLWSYRTVSPQVQLAAGVHKVKVQAKVIAGAPRLANCGGDFKVVGKLISGSGAGGVLTDILGLTGVTWSPTIASTWQDIDNGGGDQLIKTVECTPGEWLLLVLTGQFANSSSAHESYVRFDVDGTPLAQYGFDVAAAVGPNAIAHINHIIPFQATAKSHTIKVQGFSTQTSTTFAHDASLNNGLSVIRYRGGLVPVRQDGTTVVDKPVAVDFTNALVTNEGGVAKVSLLGAAGLELAGEATIVGDYDIVSALTCSEPPARR